MSARARRLAAFALAPLIGAALAACGPAHAQVKYPERPVRIIVPFGPGGVADITTRLVSEKLGDRLGQRFVVENVPGAGGIAAARAALSAPADGYTITLLTNGTAISVPLFKSLPFNPLKDFVPISSVGFFDCVFVTNATSPIKTMADFIKAAHDQPGTINVGTINVGSTQNLSAELLKSLANVNFVIIPFRTSPEAVIALLRNDIQMVVDFPAALAAGLSDHKLHPVAATGPVSAKWLNVPTVAQAGVPDYEVTSWNALYAPAAAPKDAVAVLNQALRAVLVDPDLKRKTTDLGIDTRAESGPEVDAQMRGDITKWSKVIAGANIPKQ